ncbi:MAG TPA: tetratricopeptide repeat-containing sensor histidine kinase [Candidatus Didemnitutus sp.]|nr:tetratricopeptide repeat-containing sensor histidine kinase [Candidatus Didemnitutus sp.]
MAENTDNVSISFLEMLRKELLRTPSAQGPNALLAKADSELSRVKDPAERVRIRHVLAQFHSLHADFSQAHAILDAADADCSVESDSASHTAYVRATVFHRQNKFEAARETLAPYLSQDLVTSDLELAARVHTLHAGILDALGNPEAAHDEYRIAIDLRERLGDARGMAIVYYNFAESCVRRDEHDVALEFFVRAYDIEKGLGDMASQAQSACHISILMARRGERDSALQFADESIKVATQSATPMIIAHVMANRATTFEILGDSSGRERALLETLDYLHEYPIDAILGPVLGNLGSMYLGRGDYEKAEGFLQQALEMAVRDGFQYNEGFWLFSLGKLRFATGRYPEAIDLLHRAVAILRSVKAHVYTLEALHILAQAHARNASSREAFDALAEWTKHYVDEHTAEIEKRLHDIQESRFRERKEKEEEIYRLRNVELSQALEDLQRVNAELRDLAAEKDEFMAIAAHDLRNPLGDSRGMLQTIISHYDVLDKTDVLSLCHDLLTLTMRMSNTVHAFLEISRTDRRSTGLVINPLDLTLLAKRAYDRHTTRAVAKSITLRIEIGKPNIWATGDASIVDAIIDNLITNSLKYIPAGSTVTLSVNEEDGAPFICVCDNGPGVDPAKQHLLFTKYATLGAKTTGGEESLGLGLYLAQRMASRMGARISYRENPGKGASFVLHLLR